MCGILGLGYYGKRPIGKIVTARIKALIIELFKAAETRGRDASGICLALNARDVVLYKNHVRGSELVNEEGFKKALDYLDAGELFSIIGHTRLQTQGYHGFNVNNHPITAEDVIGVHNGMIANDDALFKMFPHSMVRGAGPGGVDSEIIFRLLDMFITQGHSIDNAMVHTYERLSGGYACAFISLKNTDQLMLFNGSGPIQVYNFKEEGVLVFASTAFILNKALEQSKAFLPEDITSEFTLKAKSGLRIDLTAGTAQFVKLDKTKIEPRGPIPRATIEGPASFPVPNPSAALRRAFTQRIGPPQGFYYPECDMAEGACTSECEECGVYLAQDYTETDKAGK